MSKAEQRLVELHKLRDQLDVEIAALEDAIVRASLAKERARAAGVKLRKRDYRNRAQCGTPSGYYRHRRTLREPACDECKLAHRVAEALRVQRKRERDAQQAQGDAA